jgi:hypothetical protein
VSDEAKWWLRSGALLAVIVAFALDGARRGEEVNPSVQACVLKPDTYDGRSIWIPGATVVERSGGEARLTVGGLTLRATGNIEGLDVAREYWISGTFRAPDGFEVASSRRVAAKGERWVLNGVSAGVLALIAWAASRRLSLRSRPLIEEAR